MCVGTTTNWHFKTDFYENKMEEELENIVDNITESDFIQTWTRHQEIYAIVVYISSALSFISEALLITIILKQYKKTRFHKLLLGWAICDMLFLFTIPSFVTSFLALLNLLPLSKTLHCLFKTTDITFLFSTYFLVFVMSLNYVMENKKFTDNNTLSVIFGILISSLFINYILCIVEMNAAMIYFEILGILLALILLVITREIIACFKKSNNLERDANHRINIGRIYTINIIIAVGFSVLPLIFIQLPMEVEMGFQYISVSIFLEGFYVFIYLMNDPFFYVELKNIFKKKSNDATVSFAELQEEPSVQINFNEISIKT